MAASISRMASVCCLARNRRQIEVIRFSRSASSNRLACSGSCAGGTSQGKCPGSGFAPGLPQLPGNPGLPRTQPPPPMPPGGAVATDLAASGRPLDKDPRAANNTMPTPLAHPPTLPEPLLGTGNAGVGVALLGTGNAG